MAWVLKERTFENSLLNIDHKWGERVRGRREGEGQEEC